MVLIDGIFILSNIAANTSNFVILQIYSVLVATLSTMYSYTHTVEVPILQSTSTVHTECTSGAYRGPDGLGAPAYAAIALSNLRKAWLFLKFKNISKI